jgi:bifunctional enzyme CysN/CysC
MTTELEIPTLDEPSSEQTDRDQISIAFVGHVDHGKSTVIGRLLADTGSLPEGKIEQVRENCARNSRPFEYAFLLDALKAEQAQGITIDTARCFFHTEKRDYMVNDAPGHIEFLKNMVTGAARAEAALLVIDAEEGIQENSKRHGYILSMLGLRQVAILVNKMDLVDYDQSVYERIRSEFTVFLANIGVHNPSFIPISARTGANMTKHSDEMPWYDGKSVLDMIESFEKAAGETERPFRMPVQDIYKFTDDNDSRRIVAGMIETGSVGAGAGVTFYPSGKRSTIDSIEGFNTPQRSVIEAGYSAGFTLTDQVFIRPGETMCRSDEPTPRVASRFRANIFWMGHSPMVRDRRYKLKLSAACVGVEVAEVLNVLDASVLTSVQGSQEIERHDVAEVILEASRPIAFDLSGEVEKTSRFVIVDDYEIAGCGIVLEDLHDGTSLLDQRVREREFSWTKGSVAKSDRSALNGHDGKLIVFVGAQGDTAQKLAQELELELFRTKRQTYYLAIENVFDDLGSGGNVEVLSREGHVQQLGELARLMTDSGLLFITTLADADDYDLEVLRTLNEPNELFVVSVGENLLDSFPADVNVPEAVELNTGVRTVMDELGSREVLIDYVI